MSYIWLQNNYKIKLNIHPNIKLNMHPNIKNERRLIFLDIYLLVSIINNFLWLKNILSYKYIVGKPNSLASP